jgi:hypothetical protein
VRHQESSPRGTTINGGSSAIRAKSSRDWHGFARADTISSVTINTLSSMLRVRMTAASVIKLALTFSPGPQRLLGWYSGALYSSFRACSISIQERRKHHAHRGNRGEYHEN